MSKSVITTEIQTELANVRNLAVKMETGRSEEHDLVSMARWVYGQAMQMHSTIATDAAEAQTIVSTIAGFIRFLDDRSDYNTNDDEAITIANELDSINTKLNGLFAELMDYATTATTATTAADTTATTDADATAADVVQFINIESITYYVPAGSSRKFNISKQPFTCKIIEGNPERQMGLITLNAESPEKAAIKLITNNSTSKKIVAWNEGNNVYVVTKSTGRNQEQVLGRVVVYGK